MRSLLFVPADNERKLMNAADAGADALALDLEDSVLPARKRVARGFVADYVRSYRGSSDLWVRVNDLASGELMKDLAAIVPLPIAGLLLPKLSGAQDIDLVSAHLDMAETIYEKAANGALKIIAVCAETPAAVLRMGELLERRRPRLLGMTWGGEDLSAALGAGDPRNSDGSWRPVFEHARVQCLLACHALGVEAIDTVFVDLKNRDGCRRSAQSARHDGFTGKVAIHPDQVGIINDAFTPTAAEVERARRVVSAFESGAGSIALDGKMLDSPHLKAAKAMLARTELVARRQGGAT